MNFGNTLYEQYQTVSAINRKLAKIGKVLSAFFIIGGLIFTIVMFHDDKKLILYILGIPVAGYVLGNYVYNRVIGWAWISFTQKYFPKSLIKSLFGAADDSAVYGYITGGSSGAKWGIIGVIICAAILIYVYFFKGIYHTIKYWNLPKKEKELKIQLEQE